ncbi:hypothetical protein ACFLTI_06580, partial [Bacteroidota bacterium]
ETAANLIIEKTSATKFIKVDKFNNSEGIFNITADPDFSEKCNYESIYFQINKNGSAILYVPKPYYIYSFTEYLLTSLSDSDVDLFADGETFKPSFNSHRVSYDYFLTQEGRIQRNFNRPEYVKEIARLGFTHIEINGLAFPKGIESGPKGEIYPMFYTYCPALDQFVNSNLNKGLYPDDYLAANLKYLKENARLAKKYGLVPGLLCFEPRSVPEKFFEKYPMLRGARIDHPFRSFKPRYNMTITHPLVREHYAEMMTKLMNEVPELGYISIWTNDSGAGFEHTKSLYVGRNGGAYLIREWKDDKEIAQLAGDNAIRFFNVLKDAGSKTNPDFKVITRMESFYGEHDVIINGLDKGLEIETASLVQRGWEMPYHHPKYPDKKDINAGTIYQQQFDKKENEVINLLKKKDSDVSYYFTVGPHWMFEPLLGIPFPELTYKRLKLLNKNKVFNLAHMGGSYLPEHVPYNINHEVSRNFQYNNKLNVKNLIKQYAIKYAGREFFQDLLYAWEKTEEAIISFPNISSLYSTFGFTWYRLWLRPFVPNIEAIPQEKKDYYEKFMCTTPHNPNNVDLSRDVLFQLTTADICKKDVERIDKFVLPNIEAATNILDAIALETITSLGIKNIIIDQFVRIRALSCWFKTQRNVAAWINGVYAYMNSDNTIEKNRHIKYIKDMMRMEIENTKDLSDLFVSGVEFMSITDQGETQLIHGDNFKDLLKNRIKLMEIHMNDEPWIDMNYIERKAGEIIK